MDLQKFKDDFREAYPYIQPELSDKDIEKFLNQDYIKKLSDPMKLEYFQDYILSQGLGEVQESEQLPLTKYVSLFEAFVMDKKKEALKLSNDEFDCAKTGMGTWSGDNPSNQ